MTDTFKVNNTPVAASTGNFYWNKLKDPPKIPSDCNDSLIKAVTLKTNLEILKNSGVNSGRGMLKEEDLDSSGLAIGNIAISMTGLESLT